MSYTHGTPKNAEFRTCTCCGETFPNTDEYFSKNNRNGLNSVCKQCSNEKRKHKNEELKKRFTNNDIEYEGNKICICCGRSLPNSYKYFPIDKTSKTGLRNKCRECSSKNGHFLDDNSLRYEKWTKEEDEILIEHYKDYPGKYLQEMFLPNRTIRAIECRGSYLGLQGKTEEAKQKANEYRSDAISNKFTGRTLNEEWRKKISDAKRKYYLTHDGWWLGKHRSLEQRKLMSERMKGKWAGENNPRHIHPLNGSENGRWKGGINTTYAELRSETKEWQKSSMEFCNYKCVISGGQFDNIHHTVAFRDIVDEVFYNTNIDVKDKVADYSKDEFEKLRIETRNLHDLYGFGTCIQKDIHKLFHDKYGYTQFTPYDFLDFVYRIDCGDFDDWFKENNLEININYNYIEYLECITSNLINE